MIPGLCIGGVGLVDLLEPNHLALFHYAGDCLHSGQDLGVVRCA